MGNPQSWDLYEYALDDPIGYVDPTGQAPCRGLSNCVSRGIQIVGGVTQIGAGIILIGASGGAEAGTGGLASVVAAVGLVGGLGQIFAGVANVAAGITGDDNTSTAAQAISVVTNPAGLAATVATAGNLNAGTIASGVFDSVTSISTLYSALNNGLPASTSAFTVAQTVTAPISTAISNAVTATTDWLNGVSAPITVYTAPISVSGTTDAVQYYVAPVAVPNILTYSGVGSSQTTTLCETDGPCGSMGPGEKDNWECDEPLDRVGRGARVKR